MTFADLRKLFGPNQSIVRALGVSRQLVAHWEKHGIKSEARQVWIQVKTKGKLKADQ